MSTFYNSERLKYNQMNYNNDVELDNFCSQCLLVINAVGPSFKINDKIALHALRNNCHYIDIGGYGILRDLLKPYEKSIEAQKLCFIIGVGWMPGISGVFSKTIIETHLNSPENTNFNIYYGAVDNWSYSSTYDLAASSMGKTRSYVYSHGKEIQVSPFRYTHHKFFPFIGHKKICMPSFDEQLTQLATSLKQIRKISTFIMLNDYISMGKFMFIKIFYKHNLNKATLMLQDDYQRLVKKENKWGSVICQVSKIEPERKIDTFYYLYTKKSIRQPGIHTIIDPEQIFFHLTGASCPNSVEQTRNPGRTTGTNTAKGALHRHLSPSRIESNGYWHLSAICSIQRAFATTAAWPPEILLIN